MSDQRRPPVLITDIINQASSQLREAGIETPEHDAKLLLAEAAGVSRQTINAIEKGEYNPTINLCRSICKILDKTLDELFWEE